jgi:hypothetical protein
MLPPSIGFKILMSILSKLLNKCRQLFTNGIRQEFVYANKLSALAFSNLKKPFDEVHHDNNEIQGQKPAQHWVALDRCCAALGILAAPAQSWVGMGVLAEPQRQVNPGVRLPNNTV